VGRVGFLRAFGDHKGDQVVALGAFDDPEAFPIVSQIFIDQKPSTYALA
jgi:hypothetical protein